MKSIKTIESTKKKSDKNKALFIMLRDKGCFHTLALHLVKDTAEAQMKHNKEMEKKYATEDNFRDALMQQQYWHGIHYVLETMRRIEELRSNEASVLISPWHGTEAPPSKCRTPKALKAAFKNFRDTLLQEQLKTKGE